MGFNYLIFLFMRNTFFLLVWFHKISPCLWSENLKYFLFYFKSETQLELMSRYWVGHGLNIFSPHTQWEHFQDGRKCECVERKKC